MMILVHSSPTTLASYKCDNLGVLASPRRLYSEELLKGWTWAADNDAYSKWDEAKYRYLIRTCRGRNGLLFVTAPDVVGDSKATMQRFAEWRDELGDLPVALVAQDGLNDPPWDEFQALFIGGTTEWKLGPAAARLAREARERDKWLHMGRVNTYRRLRYAQTLGCNSIDGTQFSWFRDKWLQPFLDAARQTVIETA